MSAQKYRKKPVVIEAVQYDGNNIDELAEWSSGAVVAGSGHFEPHIITLEGRMAIGQGDYIIKGVKGEYYPCKPDIFEQTYEVVA